MPDENFGDLIAFTDVEAKVLAHYKTWMHAWLCAREHYVDLPVNTISRPRSYATKQTFTALPGQEQTPLFLAVSDGFASEPGRHGSGVYDAYLHFGIAVVCYGNDGSARTLCGHYQTAIVGIATRHRGIDGGSIDMYDFTNLRIEDIDEEAAGRSMAAVRMDLIYRVRGFASEGPALSEPPPDPEPPQPDDPLVEEVTVTVNNYEVDEELPSG